MPRWIQILVALLIGSCGSGQRNPAGPSDAKPAELPRWMEGTWVAEDGGVEHWHAVAGAMFGVGFPASGPPFEVMIIAATPEGTLGFTAWPAGDGGVQFVAREWGASHIVFSNPAHDFPREVGYRREGDALSAFIGPGGGERAASFAWRLAAPAPAPALEQSDLDFAADTASSLSAGWASWFDEEGAQWRLPRGRIQGRDAIRELMHPTFDERGVKLEWTPRASGFSPRGDLGFTVGDYVATPRTGEPGRGGYVSVWRRQADGSWRVLFDVGT